MKRPIGILSIALIAFAALWSGCSDTPSATGGSDDLSSRPQTIDFDDEFGGLNFADEAPYFADPLLVSEYGDDSFVPVTDPIANDRAVTDLVHGTQRRHFLMITWGNLNADSTINYPTDWSGALTVENGVVLLRRTIRFDARDEILPRDVRNKIEWISHTQPSFDGILVELHKMAPHDSMPGDTRDTKLGPIAEPKLSVTFRTPPLTVTIGEEDLRDLHRVVKIDDAGNAVAFNSFVVEPAACESGFLAGSWRRAPDRRGGIFRGKWIAENGVHMGFLRGHYGVNSKEEKVFFGKWINQGGNFQGMISGHWGFADKDNHGWFEGDWMNRSHHIMGGLRGEWKTSDEINGGGFFRGVWKRRCPE